MAMMLERWNDEKMDALAAKVDGMDVRLARVEVKVDERFEQVDKRFERVESELHEQRLETSELRREMKAGFDRMHRSLLGAATAIIVAMIGAPHL
jgi:predicted RNase H-like nuclease (RuvC/YqgF family)